MDDRKFNQLHMHASEKKQMVTRSTEITGSTLQIEDSLVTLDINILSSNLIYVTTVLNSGFIKQ